MKVHKYVMPVLVIISLLGTVQVAKVLGYWATTSKGEVMVDDAGRPDPAGIKGWMTLANVSATYGIPQERLYAETGVPSDQDPETALKDLEKVIPDFEVELIREAVGKYYEEIGAQITSEGDALSP